MIPVHFPSDLMTFHLLEKMGQAPKTYLVTLIEAMWPMKIRFLKPTERQMTFQDQYETRKVILDWVIE